MGPKTTGVLKKNNAVTILSLLAYKQAATWRQKKRNGIGSKAVHE